MLGNILHHETKDDVRIEETNWLHYQLLMPSTCLTNRPRECVFLFFSRERRIRAPSRSGASSLFDERGSPNDHDTVPFFHHHQIAFFKPKFPANIGRYRQLTFCVDSRDFCNHGFTAHSAAPPRSYRECTGVD